MQIVIDIPDEIWEGIKHVEHKSYAELIILKATKNGTPLPEKHGDLKDKMDMCCKDCNFCEYTHTCEIYGAPTIIKATAL